MKQTKPSKPPAGNRPAAPTRQWGGTILGFIAGVIVGLVVALLVAVYVTKVPVPFMGAKTQGRNAEHDAAEDRKNQNWDPNSPLHGKSPARPTPPVAAASQPPGTPPAAQAPATQAPAGPVAAPRPAASADPLGDLARARSAAPAAAAPPLATAADPFEYFVQAGAFRTPEDAEAQRARLAMLGMEARVTEREQAGRTVFRVRLGPYKSKEDADRMKQRLDGIGADSALVRVQR